MPTSTRNNVLAESYFSKERRDIFHVGYDPVTVSQAAIEEWNLTPKEFLGQGALAVCILCTDNDSNEVVVKAAADYELVRSEHAGLTLWQASGIFPVPLAPYTPTSSLPAYVMERVSGRPPTFSVTCSPDEQVWLTERAVELWIAWQQPYNEQNTQHNSLWNTVFTPEEAFGKRHAWCKKRLSQENSPRTYQHLIDDAYAAALRLTETCTDKALCHGDFSYRNVLLDYPLRQRPAVKACDPFAYCGDPLADLANWTTVQPHDKSSRTIEAAASAIQTALPHLAQRFDDWLVIHATFEANLATSEHNGAAEWIRHSFASPAQLKQRLLHITHS